MQSLRDDLSYSVRALLRRPAVPALVVLVLGLGIGTSSTVFAIVDRIFYRLPAGVRAPQELRRLYAVPAEPMAGQVRSAFTAPEYHDLREAVAPPAQIAAYLHRDETPCEFKSIEHTCSAAWVTASFFDLLDARLTKGREFRDEEDEFGSPNDVVVVSFEFWRRTLGEDPNVLGQSLTIAGKAHTIVGVAAGEFAGVETTVTDLWIPLAAFAGFQVGGHSWYSDRGLRALSVIARMPAGSSEGAIASRVEARLHAGNAEAAFGDTSSRIMLGSIIAGRGPGSLSQADSIAAGLAGVSLLFMLIAAANASNLLIAGGMRRRRETAVRLALGIGRWRLARQVLFEIGILAVVAAIVAALLSSWSGSFLRTLIFDDVRWAGQLIDERVLGFTLFLAVVSGLVAALGPAIHIFRDDLATLLVSGARSGGPRDSLARRVLLTAQATLSVFLVMGAALFVRSLQEVHRIELGYDVDRLITITTRATDSPIALREVADIVRRAPGVEAAALTAVTPLQAQLISRTFDVAGDSLGYPGSVAEYMAVGGDFFRVAGLRVLRGRGFLSRDVANEQAVTVVSAALARAAWPSQEPLGQCLRIRRATAPCYEVVGVVENATAGTLVERPRMTFYVSLEQKPESLPTRAILVRARGDLVTVTNTVHAAVGRVGGAAYDYDIRLLTDVLAPQYRPWNLSAQLFGSMGILSLLLAATGLFGILSQTVAARRRELAIRASLGATPGLLLAIVVGEGFRRILLGIIIGAVTALGFGQIIASRLYGISPLDPQALALAIGVVIAFSALATILPALQAARVDPVAALNSD